MNVSITARSPLPSSSGRAALCPASLSLALQTQIHGFVLARAVVVSRTLRHRHVQPEGAHGNSSWWHLGNQPRNRVPDSWLSMAAHTPISLASRALPPMRILAARVAPLLAARGAVAPFSASYGGGVRCRPNDNWCTYFSGVSRWDRVTSTPQGCDLCSLYLARTQMFSADQARRFVVPVRGSNSVCSLPPYRRHHSNKNSCSWTEVRRSPCTSSRTPSAVSTIHFS